MIQIWLLAMFPLAALAVMPAVPARARVWLPVAAAALNLADFSVGLARLSALERASANSWFQWDTLSLTVTGITLFVGFTAALYSVRYLRLEAAGHSRERLSGAPGADLPDSVGDRAGDSVGDSGPGGALRMRQTVYPALFLAFYVMLVFAPLFQNVLFTWACIEATALTSVMLVDFHRTRTSAEAAWKYIILMEFGGVAALFGTITVLLGEPAGVHAATWSSLAAVSHSIPGGWELAGFVLALAGYGTKAGLVPFNAWLPDAHSQAPSPVSAMLSAAKLNTALYAIVRFSGVLVAGGHAGFANGAIAGVGFLTVAVSTMMTVRQHDFKRLFAYSSSENIGLIALGFAFGPLGTAGALLQMVSHSVIKSLLFYQSGDLSVAAGSTRMQGLGGFAQAFPWSGGTLVLGFLAIAGAPPFGLFLGEFTILDALFRSGAPWLAAATAGLLAVLFANFTRYAVQIAFGRPTGPVRRFKDLFPAKDAAAGLPFGLHITAATLLGTALPGLLAAVGRFPV